VPSGRPKASIAPCAETRSAAAATIVPTTMSAPTNVISGRVSQAPLANRSRAAVMVSRGEAGWLFNLGPT
jgi:hypothetical protein